MDGVPVSVAVVAGALSTLNPCGFPLLPAFLTFYVGADRPELPSAATRLAQGLVTGLLVTAGFLAVFSVVGLPVSYGARAVARAVPFAGIGIGLILAAIGLRGLFGRPLGLRLPLAVTPGSGRGARSMLLFGAGYALASLACTLPVFLALVGASLSAGGSGSALIVFAAYGAGMAVVLMALALAAAVLQRGLARRLRRIMPVLPRLSAALLILSGSYVTYYWLSFR
jgi:cytochrome c biogenesis protein CcdA